MIIANGTQFVKHQLIIMIISLVRTANIVNFKCSYSLWNKEQVFILNFNSWSWIQMGWKNDSRKNAYFIAFKWFYILRHTPKNANNCFSMDVKKHFISCTRLSLFSLMKRDFVIETLWYFIPLLPLCPT